MPYADPEKRRAYHHQYYLDNPDKSGRAYYQAHIERCREVKRQSRERNRDKVREANRAYYWANREKRQAYNRAWRENNPDKIRANHDPVRNREHEARRRAQKRGTQTSRVDLGQIWDRDEGVCHICGEPVERGDLEFDHAIPLSRGGTHTKGNIFVSHRKCNRSKHSSILPERQLSLLRE